MFLGWEHIQVDSSRRLLCLFFSTAFSTVLLGSVTGENRNRKIAALLSLLPPFFYPTALLPFLSFFPRVPMAGWAGLGGIGTAGGQKRLEHQEEGRRECRSPFFNQQKPAGRAGRCVPHNPFFFSEPLKKAPYTVNRKCGEWEGERKAQKW